jgi:hypothetical protein
MLGNCVIGKARNDMMPTSIKTKNNNTDGTGLRIDQAEKFQFI